MPLPATGPQTYAQWSDCLDRLAAGLEDDACLAQMARGTLAWSGGVGPLFAQRLADEFNARLTRCSERLTRDLRAGADESSVVRAIVNARQSLFFLHRLAQLPAFAETLRSHLVREVRGFAERSQQSLEDSARADRSGRLRLLLQNNPLLRYDTLSLAAVPEAPAPAAAPAATPPAAPRRRNILI
ncbi:hypothetical protein [Comamonas antarctica]|uniref:hypothetical protein n=1 Tax=Comamonas antarctica TaxID=2743470 RepID=UPI0028E674E3|nr:hypothetical protein [Comamonas antarctica]